jgi:flagellar assembly protein FliH
VTTRKAAASGVAALPGPRVLEGQGLSVRRSPVHPGRPIDYASLSTCVLVEGATADRGYEAGYADGQRDAEALAKDAERASALRLDDAVSALLGSVDAARSAYEERFAELESAVPRFAFQLLEALIGRESELAVEPGREAVARALALDESTLPVVARLSPDDAETIGDLADRFAARPVTVVADPTVEPGGAVVEIGSTTIDTQLSRALGRVRAVIVGHPEEDQR